VWLLALLVASACASPEVNDRQYYQGEKLPRPDRILVYDFTASPAAVPAESAFVAEKAVSPIMPTQAQLDMTAKLGAEVARQVTENLQEAGLPALRAVGEPAPKINDIVIRGYFVSQDEGSAARRMLVGFGSGNAQLTTAVEGFQMTSHGLRQLGSGSIDSSGGRTPGLILPLAVMAATASPIGLVVGGTVKVAEEATGSSTIEGSAKRTADVISEQLVEAAKRQGWL
jgi:hypothetical protein